MSTKSLIIIGGNRESEDSPLDFILDYASAKNLKLLYVTNSIHLKKPCKTYKSFKDFLEKKKVSYIVKNSLKNINFLQNYIRTYPETKVLTTFCFFKINEKIINLFKNKIFNYHLGKIPEQVGASATFWYMMSSQKKTAITFHKISKEFDSGDIVYEKKLNMKKEIFSLNDLYKLIRKQEKKSINTFFDIIFKKKNVKSIKKNLSNKVYMPKLNTLVHGFIDWNWSAKDIATFCSVFDDPYAGASTFLEKKRIHLKKVSYHKHKINFHPFQYGIIFNKDKTKIYVACKNGYIKANIYQKKKLINLNKIILGRRLYTDQGHLDKAKKSRSIHTGKGIKINV